MKFIKFSIFLVFVVSLFLVVFCLYEPADGILKAKTSIKNWTIPSDMFLFHRKVCWPDGWGEVTIFC